MRQSRRRGSRRRAPRQQRRSSGRAAACRPAAPTATSSPLASRKAFSAPKQALVMRESSLCN